MQAEKGMMQLSRDLQGSEFDIFKFARDISVALKAGTIHICARS